MLSEYLVWPGTVLAGKVLGYNALGRTAPPALLQLAFRGTSTRGSARPRSTKYVTRLSGMFCS